VIWFRREHAEDLTATLELRVRLRPSWRAVPFRLRIEDGRMRLRPGAVRDPQARATFLAGDLVRLAIGRACWPALLTAGRLELTGDPFLALRLPLLFGLRAAAKPTSSRS
jgi:SCP-2 sterol transfer family